MEEVPVLARVAEIFRAMIPALPIPVKHHLPSAVFHQFKSVFHLRLIQLINQGQDSLSLFIQFAFDLFKILS